jgi:predicted regulator of Ras-like GTPase activity (Roadblock/LC7/MglB family)
MKTQTRTAAALAEKLEEAEVPDHIEEHHAEIVVLPPRNPRGEDQPQAPLGVEMDEDIAASWGLWSEQIGRALLPTLQRLADSLPAFSSAMICTADGFNLCTIGVDEDQVSRLSAMTSSLHSIADAVSSSVHDDEGGPLDMVTLTNGSSKTVVLAVRELIVGQLLLWVTVGDDSLGALLMRARVAAESIRDKLGDE